MNLLRLLTLSIFITLVGCASRWDPPHKRVQVLEREALAQQATTQPPKATVEQGLDVVPTSELVALTPIVVDAEHGESINEELDKIAINLIFALAQIPDLLPIDTTIQLTTPSTTFGHIVESRLVDAGFGVRRTTDQIGKYPVKYALTSDESKGGRESRVSLSIGSYEIERNYAITLNSVTPMSPIIMRGYDVNNIVMNDDVLNHVVDGKVITQAELIAYIHAHDHSTDDDAPVTLAERLSSAEFSELVKQNMYTIMQSNYVGLFKEFEDVTESVLIFPNDSTRLSDVNKSKIKDIIAKMNPETDVISLIGCSHGSTATQLDNEALATGRANIVKLELVSNGVAFNRVLDEGCWASGYHPRFPN